MRLAGSLERARAIPDTRRAEARDLHYDLEHEISQPGGGHSEEDYDEADQAVSHLEERFPGLRAESRQMTRQPNLSRGARERMREDSEKPLGGVDREEHRRQARQPNRTVRQRVASATAVHARRRGSRSRFSLGSAASAIPGGGTATQLLLRTLGGVAGLSFLYVLLTPKGSRAVGLTSTGVTDVLRALADPSRDPLQSRASLVQQGAGQVQAAKAGAAVTYQTPSGPVTSGTFDTPTGRAPFKPPTKLGGKAGLFNTPGGYAPYKPPTRIPGLKIVR